MVPSGERLSVGRENARLQQEETTHARDQPQSGLAHLYELMRLGHCIVGAAVCLFSFSCSSAAPTATTAQVMATPEITVASVPTATAVPTATTEHPAVDRLAAANAEINSWRLCRLATTDYLAAQRAVDDRVAKMGLALLGEGLPFAAFSYSETEEELFQLSSKAQILKQDCGESWGWANEAEKTVEHLGARIAGLTRKCLELEKSYCYG